jgi:hypothetical protein
MATYYLVIIDTNSNYFSLDAKMYQLHKRLDYPIDTGGNYYNIKKDEIMLPENDEDEIYAGTYYHRRYPSQFLSLEYLDSYDGNNSKPKTICLLAGIYETKLSADSACEKLRLIEPKTYVQKSSIYIGCIH